MDDVDAVYRALKRDHRRLLDCLQITYRCGVRWCLLLHVVETPAGIIIHRPRYRLSPTLNEARSNGPGRAKNTEDGDRRWRAATFPIETSGLKPSLPGNVGLGLACDHIDVLLSNNDFAAHWASRTAVYRVGSKPTTYARV